MGWLKNTTPFYAAPDIQGDAGEHPARAWPLISTRLSVYRMSMPYIRIVFSLAMLLLVITFCVNNTQEFSLSFLSYRLAVPLQFWTLMVIFFAAGMVPVLVLEIPRQASHFMRMRTLKAQIRLMETSLKGLSGSAEDAAD
jgi:uncharacterized integral membrane protein